MSVSGWSDIPGFPEGAGGGGFSEVDNFVTNLWRVVVRGYFVSCAFLGGVPGTIHDGLPLKLLYIQSARAAYFK